ncbi:MAG: hypothetical protein JXB06_02245 [Spirochaetales bacterium]|nr:hypothetical protein [Spirochaetales bacterium]
MSRGGSENPFPAPGITVDFATYLEAKFAIDSASLNPGLYRRFREHLERTPDARILDLGTGTGAMLRRIIDFDLRGRVRLVGVDREKKNLAAAKGRVRESLRKRGYRLRPIRESSRARRINAEKQGCELVVDLLGGDLLDERTTASLEAFHCITAHAFMDLMPLEPAVAVILSLLKAGGIFYPTLNYDGQTVLLPEYDQPGFERRVLRIYDRSMECRRLGGRKTGGALSGRRLYRALLDGGLAILGMGSSDWNVFPHGGVHGAREKIFLTAVLSMIAGEARQYRAAAGPSGGTGAKSRLDPTLLEDWQARRLEDVEEGRLSLVVHQLDILAGLPPG